MGSRSICSDGHAQRARKVSQARALHKEAWLVQAPAMALHAAVGLVVQATGLADDEVGGAQLLVQPVHAVFDTAVVELEAAAGGFDDVAVARLGAAHAAHAEHTLAAQQDGLGARR